MHKVTVPLADLYSPVRNDLRIVERIFDEELTSELPFLNGLCDQVRSYRGKMLRPALLLLTGQAVGGRSADLHTLAAVVEMVHMATLVHDDVLDQADERRGRPPVSALSGNITAVLLGDYLISHAYHLCSSLDTPHAARRIGATTNIVCEGELLQNKLRGNANLTEEEYLEVISRKTGALTAVACELGAAYAGADAGVVAAMRSYGMSAGIAFQIIDDLLDILGERAKVGKTLGTDLTMGKLTLPTIHCLANGSESAAAGIREALIGKRRYDPHRLRGWLEEADSIEYSVNVATEHVVDAVRQLDLLPPSDARASLTALAEFIIRRQS